MATDAFRKLMSHLDVLTESRGLSGRKPGDTFVDPSTKSAITFDSLSFYPEGGGRFETAEEMQQAIASIETTLGQPIQWENNAGSRTGGFALAIFSTDTGKVPVGTYLQKVSPNPMDNYVPNIILGKYRFSSKAAQKTQDKVTPQDLLATKDSLTSEDIIAQLEQKLGPDNSLVTLTKHVAMGGKLPYKFTAPADISFTGFRDYFCEIIQPIALQRGLYTGNAAAAVERFLSPNTFADTTISFDQSKNAGLADSVMTAPDGKYLRISSKGEKGAEASVKNLVDSIEAVSDTGEGQQIISKYGDVLDIIRAVKENGQSGAPLVLGVQYGILDEEDANQIRKLRTAPLVNINDKKALASFKLSSNLTKLLRGRTNKKPEETSLYYHLIASVAHEVANHVNNNTNFSDAASDILNNGALIQVYTKASESGGQWTLQQFQTVYPGKSVTGVLFSAQKNYSSTSIKGNFTFYIMRDNAKPPKDSNKEETSTIDAEPVVDFEKQQEKRKKSITQLFKDVSNSEKPADTNIGRERQ